MKRSLGMIIMFAVATATAASLATSIHSWHRIYYGLPCSQMEQLSAVSEQHGCDFTQRDAAGTIIGAQSHVRREPVLDTHDSLKSGHRPPDG